MRPGSSLLAHGGDEVLPPLTATTTFAIWEIGWPRSDAREARRVDRHLDRTYGDELLPPWWNTRPRRQESTP